MAFSVGDLPEEELDFIRRHQESCTYCEDRARSLEARTDGFIDDLRMSLLGRREAGATPPPFEPAETEGGAGVGGGGDWAGLSDYEVIGQPLGAGGMGIVYKARHRKLDRVVALKMIPGRSSQASALFRIEAKAVAQLQHPNIVQIFEIGRHEGQPFLALEFVEGGTLEGWIAGRRQPPREAAELVQVLALAVAYAHRRGVIHCDLKPSNILMTPEGVPKIGDFGIAKWLKSGEGWGEEGDIVGTPRYMTPEQASGAVGAVGPSADVYGLGVLLYEMLTGTVPHHADGRAETLRLIRERDPVPIRCHDPSLPPDLEAVVMRCLRKDPSGRYADARALADDLGRFLAGEPILGRDVGPIERVGLVARRHPAIVGVLAVSTLWFAALWVYHRWHDARIHNFEDNLKKVTRTDVNEAYVDKPVLISQDADGSVRLRAFEAALSGTTLVLEPRFGNIGHWKSADDRAVWTFRVTRESTFSVILDYSNSDETSGNPYQVSVGGTTLLGHSVDTGSWSRFRPVPVGEVSLPRGIHFLELYPALKPRGALFDLRSVNLMPR